MRKKKTQVKALSKCRNVFAVSRIFVADYRQQKVHASESHNTTRLCVQVEDELNISPGMLCWFCVGGEASRS